MLRLNIRDGGFIDKGIAFGWFLVYQDRHTFFYTIKELFCRFVSNSDSTTNKVFEDFTLVGILWITMNDVVTLKDYRPRQINLGSVRKLELFFFFNLIQT